MASRFRITNVDVLQLSSNESKTEKNKNDNNKIQIIDFFKTRKQYYWTPGSLSQ